MATSPGVGLGPSRRFWSRRCRLCDRSRQGPDERQVGFLAQGQLLQELVVSPLRVLQELVAVVGELSEPVVSLWRIARASPFV